jgi:MFS family permease
VLLVTVDDYRAVFVCSTGLAVVGLAVLSLVRDPSRDRPRRPRAAAGPWTAPLRDAVLRRTCAAAGLLALLTVSDAFLLLALQQRADLQPGWFPLLFVGVAASYALLALPVGRLTDRLGAVPVLLAGHVVLAAACLTLLPDAVPLPAAVVVVVLLGAYYAATDGVLMALVARRLPAQVRGTAMGAVQTAVAAGRLLSSVAFGALWWGTSATVALSSFAAGLLVVLPVAAWLLRPGPEVPR